MEFCLNKTPLEDPLYTRNNGFSEAPLNYESVKAVEKSGIPFNLALSLTICDKANTIWNTLIEMYTERGLGKILKNHQVEFSKVVNADWKYTEISKLLWPQIFVILNLKRQIDDVENDCITLVNNVFDLCSQKEIPIIPDVMKDAFIKVIDLCFIADIVLEMKESLHSTYEKFTELPISSQQTVAESNYGDALYLKKLFDTKNYFRSELKEKLHPHNLDVVFEDLVNYSIRKVISSTSTLPGDHFCYLRSISQLFWLLDEIQTKNSVFKNTSILLPEAQKLFRIYPFVYVEYDIVYDVFDILSSCQTWESVANTKPYTIKPERTEYRYLLEKKIPKMKEQYCTVLIGLQMLPEGEEDTQENNAESIPPSSLYQTRSGESSIFSLRRSQSVSSKSLLSDTTGTIHEETVDLKHVTLNKKQEVILKAYHLLRSMAIDLRLFWVWKLAHPQTLHECSQCKELYPSHCYDTMGDDRVCQFCKKQIKKERVNKDNLTYMERISYNYTENEIRILLEYMRMQQDLMMVLGNYQYDLSTILYSLLYEDIQQLIRVDVLYWLHHADRHGKKADNEKRLLLKIREVVCDWLGEQPPPPDQEYKLRSKERSKLEITCVKRAILPSMTQILVLQSLLSVFADPHSTAVVYKFFPRGTILTPNDLHLIQEHRSLIQDCVNLNSFQFCMKELTSLHFYGVTEGLNEKCSSWNIPSTMHFSHLLSSYILKHIFKVSSSVLFTPLILLKSVYSKQIETVDAQWILDEVECDVGSYLNDIVGRITHKLYRWCKTCAVHRMNPDKALPSPIVLDIKELDRTLTVCDRSFNLYQIICHQMNEHFKNDIQSILHTMESSSICFIVELVTLLQFLQFAHTYCSHFCTLESFSDMITSLSSTDQSTGGQNRINQWINKEVYFLLSNGEYDKTKNCFVLQQKSDSATIDNSLYGYAGNGNRRRLQNSDSLVLFSSQHIQSLLILQQITHSAILPGLIYHIDDILDCVAGDICQCVGKRKPVSISMSVENIASLFRSLQEAYTEPVNDGGSLFDQVMSDCIILNNSYRLLIMMEREYQLYSSLHNPSISNEILSAIRSILDSQNEKDLGFYSLLRDQLRNHLNFDEKQISFALPLFAKIAQLLSSNTDMCEQFSSFVDYFVFSLFERNSLLNTSAEYDSLFQSFCFSISFLLTVTRCWSAFVDGGDCMKFVALCRDQDVMNDGTVNVRIKDFMNVAMHFVRQMENERQRSPFLEIAKESQTLYVVNNDASTFSYDAFFPSYVTEAILS